MRGELLVYSSLLFLLALLIAGVLFRAYINWQKPRLRMHGFSRSGLFDLTRAAVPGIIDYLRDAIIVVDRRDHITDINRSACRWLKVDPGCLGQRVFDVLPKADLFLEQWNIPDARILLETKATDSHSWYDVRIIEIRDRQDIPAGRVIVAHDNTYEQELLEAEKHKSAHLALLEEAGRQIAGSLDEKEIVQRTVEAVVNRFGYVEAAISLLIDEKELEVAAISGTQDYGFKTGYRQELGAGIIGYVGKTCKTYVANDVKEDPYYFSNAEHEGSAVGVPIMNEKELIGVLYVESAEKGSFKAADTQMMVTLANQVASSLQRARLYAGAQEHLRIMSIVQSISQVISSSLDLDGIFKAVVRMLKETFGYTYVSIYLLIDDYLHLGA
jgi:putative methionine-R-sulfoxide reductase with GAF domain